MTKLLQKLKFKQALVLLIIFPLAGLIYFAVQGSIERLAVAREMETLQDFTQLAVQSSNLVHELQRERGASAGYIGSRGADFGNRLENQRSVTLQQIEDLENFLAGFDRAALPQEMRETLSRGELSLNNLQSIRRGITDLNLDLDDALEYYSETIAHFLDLIGMMAQTSGHGGMVNQAAGYHSFLLAKENTGIQRAVLSNTFAADQFAPGIYHHFVEIVAARELHLDTFLTGASPAQLERYQNTMQAEAVEEVARLEELAFSKADEGGFGVEPGYWYDVMTERIDLMKKGEDGLAADLLSRAEHLRNEANDGLRLFLIVTLAIFGITVLVAFAVGRSILRQIGGEPAFMNAIAGEVAQGNLDQKDLDLSSVKESSGVYRALLEMVIALRQKAELIKRIANKDLTVTIEKVSEKDGLGESLIIMRESLHELISQVNNAVGQVASGSDQVSQASQSLSQGATEQASSLEEITSSITEINGQTKTNAENAGTASSLAKAALDDARKGNTEMNRLNTIMEDIDTSSAEINKIVKVIDDIAFQINLLALNANVEAARAGKYGKGFAVVAEEVRNLAVRSAESVKETNAVVEKVVGSIKVGTQSAATTAGQLTNIVDGSGKVADILEEIAQASKDQVLAIDQITEALEQIDQVTQGNTAAAEESASAAEELASQSQELRSLVAVFRLIHA